jgi:hypothetical protein
MRRRDSITLMGGAALWPLAAHAQQPARMWLIGTLLTYREDDRDQQSWFETFKCVFTQIASHHGSGFGGGFPSNGARLPHQSRSVRRPWCFCSLQSLGGFLLMYSPMSSKAHSGRGSGVYQIGSSTAINYNLVVTCSCASAWVAPPSGLPGFGPIVLIRSHVDQRQSDSFFGSSDVFIRRQTTLGLGRPRGPTVGTFLLKMCSILTEGLRE